MKLDTANKPSERQFPTDLFAYGCQIHIGQKRPLNIPLSSPLQHFSFHFAQPQTPPPSLAWLHHISENNSDGEIWYSVGRIDDAYFLRFEKSGDFIIHPNSNSIECRPNPGVDDDTLMHLLLNQVLPRLLVQQGNTILHAGAVALAENSHAIAFVGPTGSGKSTLSTLFSKYGASLMTDDCLRIKSQGTETLAIPAYPSIRLWGNGCDKILPKNQYLPSLQNTRYSSKICLQYEHFPYQFCSRSIPLSALYLLNPERKTPQDISITPASKSETVRFLTGNCFRLDVEDSAQLKNEFNHLVNLAKKIPAYHLSYQKKWNSIRDLYFIILNHEKTHS